MRKIDTQVKRELLVWVLLIFISVTVGVAMSFVVERMDLPLALPSESGGPVAINIKEMVRSLFHELSLRVLGVFLLLAAARLIFLSVSNRTMSKS